MKVYRKIILTSVILLSIPNFAFSVNAPFTDRMEIGTNGWVASGSDGTGSWIRTSTPAGATFPAQPPPSQSYLWETKTWADKYKESKIFYLDSSQIDLGSLPLPVKPFLSFYTWYSINNTANKMDGVIVQVNSGGTWYDLDTTTNSQGQYDQQIGSNDPPSQPLNGKYAFTGDSSSTNNNWERKIFELKNDAGQYYSGVIQIRFYFASDSNKPNKVGIAIDDVIVGTNLDADRYIRVLPPEPTPISTSSITNNMTAKIQVQDLLGYKEAIPGVYVSLSFSESNPNPSVSATSANPADASSGEATITIKDTEKESVILIPNSAQLPSVPSSNKISATGKFLSPFIKIWDENE